MSGTVAGWTPERRAQQSALMKRKNADPDFVTRRLSRRWTDEQRTLKRQEMLALNADPLFREKQREGCRKRKPRGFRSIPESIHPCVRGFFVEMNAQRATRAQIARRTSVTTYTQTNWKRSMPLLDVLDAALGGLGLELAIVPRGSRNNDGFLKRTQTKNWEVAE